MASSENRFLVPILVMGTFGILCTETGVIGILPQICERFGVGMSEAGLLVSGFALAVAAAGAVLPAALSGMNRKHMMLLVLGAFAAGNVAFAFAPTFQAALAARVLPAFLHPVYCSASYALAEQSVAPADAPKASAKVMMGVSAGMVVGVPLASAIGSAASTSAVMLAFAAINLAAFLATLVLVPSMPVRTKATYLQQVSAIKSPLAVVSLLAGAAIQAAIFATYAYAAEFLGEVGGVAEGAQSAVLLCFGAASLLGNYAAGRMLSTRARAALVGLPLAVMAVYAALFAGAGVLPVLVAAVAAWGVVYGFGNNVQQFVVSRSMPSAPDFANGMFISFGNIGITVGTAVGGVFLTAGGAGLTLVPSLCFALLSLGLLCMRAHMADAQPATAGADASPAHEGAAADAQAAS